MATTNTSTTYLLISWTLVDNVTATSYTISYSNTQCFTDSVDITDIGGGVRQYLITGLQEGTEYSITVTATLSDWETGEDREIFITTTMSSG